MFFNVPQTAANRDIWGTYVITARQSDPVVQQEEEEMAARLLLRSALRAATVSRACPALAHTRGMAAGGKTRTPYIHRSFLGFKSHMFNRNGCVFRPGKDMPWH